MNLPTNAEVAAATRHVATFAAGAIAMFGLSTKISPEVVTSIITAAGTFVNDLILLIGLVAPLISGYLASRSASPQAQLAAVAANPDVAGVVTKPTAAGQALAAASAPTVTPAGTATAKSLAAGG